MTEQVKSKTQIIHGVECGHRHEQVVDAFGWVPRVLHNGLAVRRGGEQRTGIPGVDFVGEGTKPRRPSGIGAADQERPLEPPLDQRNPLEAVFERAVVEKQFRTGARGAVAANWSRFHVEQGGHAALVRWARPSDKEPWLPA